MIAPAISGRDAQTKLKIQWVVLGVGRANFFPDRSGPSQNFCSKNWTEPVRAKILLQKIRTEPKRAKKNLDRAGPSQNIALRTVTKRANKKLG